MTKYIRKKLPENVQKYFDDIIQKQEGARLLVILDPKRLLKLNNRYINASGNEWKVYQYYENDLSFRMEYKQKPADPNFQHIIWVTYPPGVTSGKINLTFIGDILEQTDEILDLDILAILKELVPEETWPEDSLAQYELEIANQLDRFVTNSMDLRKSLPKGAPLNQNHIMALVLVSGPASLPLNRLLFDVSNAVELIEEYLYFVYLFELHKEEKRTLKQLIRNYARNWKGVEVWLEIDEVDLAFFLYSWDILKKYEIDNPLNQIKGWGSLGFDPENLKELADQVVNAIRKNENIWTKVTNLAENATHEVTIKKIVTTLSFKTLDKLYRAIQNESLPMIVYGMCINLLEIVTKEKDWQKRGIQMPLDLSSHPLLGDSFFQTKYLPAAQALLSFFQDMNLIQKALNEPIALSNELANFLNWYQKKGFYRLQFLLSRCLQKLKDVGEKELRDKLVKYLHNDIKINIQNFLQKLDMHLAEIIERNWKEYERHPRLSCKFIDDFVIKRSIEPSQERRLWLLILDGMRLDTWEEVVKPRLQERFEVLDQILYVSPLPSVTKIARTSLLAGSLPSNWKDYGNVFTTDHNILTSRNFLLSREAGKSKLRIVVASETDYGQRKLDSDIKLYNILIYNLNDDRIHTFRDDIFQLNEDIKGYLERSVLPDLVNRIGDNDYILVTSDHGFIELSREGERKIKVEDPYRVNFRYLNNIESKIGFKVQYKPGEFYTLAKGRNWFGREKGRFSRYAHGGISLDEMVVPGVLMKKITEPIIAFEFTKLIPIVEVIEDSVTDIEIVIRNTGNRDASFQLIVEPGIGKSETFNYKISPLNDKLCSFKFKPSLKSRRIQLSLGYKDAKGKKIRRINTIPIKVLEKKEKFEMDLRALDKLEIDLEKEK